MEGGAWGPVLWAGQYFIFWTCITFTFLMGRALWRGEIGRGGLNLLASGNRTTSKGNRVVHLIFPENCFSLFRSPESLSDQHQSFPPHPSDHPTASFNYKVFYPKCYNGSRTALCIQEGIDFVTETRLDISGTHVNWNFRFMLYVISNIPSPISDSC